MTAVETYERELQQAQSELPAAPAGLRERAWEQFATAGFPTTRLEDWKYTNLKDIAEAAFGRTVPTTSPDAETLRQVRALSGAISAHELLFLDGVAANDTDPTSGLTTGVVLKSIADALSQTPGTVERILTAVAGIERSSLVSLNTAFLASGALIEVPDDTVVERPIHLIYAASADRPATHRHVRNLISLGRNSRATVIEHSIGLGQGSYWTNSATDIALGDGSRLEHYKIQRESQNAFHTAAIAAQHDANSVLHSVSIALGARLCRIDITSNLAAPGAETILDGLYMVDGEQHIDHHTRVDHAAPNCRSEELYKGILGGRGTGVFNGKVLVHEDGQRTDAQQLNKNLLLSDAATINTKPQLEIFADDVKCSHGATTGRLDDESIFYLRARGIDEAAARSLLTYAFANEIVERLGAETLRDELEKIVRERLTAMGGIGGTA